MSDENQFLASGNPSKDEITIQGEDELTPETKPKNAVTQEQKINTTEYSIMAAGDINIYKHMADPNTDSFVDASLFPENNGAIDVDLSDGLTDALTLLNKNRLLLIVCEERDFSFHGTQILFERFDAAKQYEKKLIDPYLAKTKTTNSINTVLADIFKQPSKLSVVVDIFRHEIGGTSSFLIPLSVKEGLRHLLDASRSQLQSRDQYLIILCNPSQYEATKIPTDVPHWRIDAVKILLKQVYEKEFELLFDKVQKQIQTGKWGSDPYGELRKAKETNRLLELINFYNADSEKKDNDEIKALFDSEDAWGEIVRAALFTTAYFPSISVNEFEKLMAIFLGDRNGEEKQIETVRNETETIEREVARDISLKRLWLEKRRKILTGCKITSSKQIIGFEMPHLQKVVQDIFNKYDPFFVKDRFQDLWASGSLFDQSKRLSDNIVEFIAQMAEENPEEFGSQWLANWAGQKAIEHLTRKTNVYLVAQHDQSNANFLDFISEIDRADFIIRLGYLLRAMHVAVQRKSGVLNIADDFIKELYIIAPANEIVDYISQLWEIPEFRPLYWLKRLIAESDETIRDKSTSLLQQYIRRNIHKQTDNLNEILTWVRTDENLQDTSVLEQAVLTIFIVISIDSIKKIERANYGKIENLFITINNNKVDFLSPKFEVLLRGLSNPLQQINGANEAINYLLSSNWFHSFNTIFLQTENNISINLLLRLTILLDTLKENNMNNEALIVLVILEWLIALQGLPTNKEQKNSNKKIIEIICAQLCKYISEQRLRKILLFTTQASNFILEITNDVSLIDRDLGKELSERRILLKIFAESLHNINKTAKNEV